MGSCEKKKIEDYVRSIPDFPEEGVIFRDVTSILQNADGFALAIDSSAISLLTSGTAFEDRSSCTLEAGRTTVGIPAEKSGTFLCDLFKPAFVPFAIIFCRSMADIVRSPWAADALE